MQVCNTTAAVVTWHEESNAESRITPGNGGIEMDQESKPGAETELRFARFCLDKASDPIVWTTSDARIVDVNEAACRVFGYAREELLQMSIFDYNQHLNAEKWTEHISELKLRGSVKFETEHRAKDGRVFPAEISANYVEFGTEVRTFAFVRDITKRKLLEEERERLVSDLREALSKVKTLSGMLPICASCKKIRNDDGYWEQIECYIRKHSEAEFSHGICPECIKELYPEL